jgi:hypothetical protein
MEGTLSYSARHKRSAQDRHGGKHSHAGRRTALNSMPPDRAETDPAQVPADQDTHAPQHLGAPTEE